MGMNFMHMALHVHLGGVYPHRRFSLLGFAHPVMGKSFFLGTGGTPGN